MKGQSFESVAQSWLGSAGLTISPLPYQCARHEEKPRDVVTPYRSVRSQWKSGLNAREALAVVLLLWYGGNGFALSCERRICHE